MEWRQTTTTLPTTPTDLGTATDRLAVAALLATSLASLTGSEGVKATVGESSMQNSLARATMAITAVEAGGRSSVRALVLGGQGRAVRYPCRRARKKYITINRIQRREKRNVRPCMPPWPPTTTKMPTRGHDHTAGGGTCGNDNGERTVVGERAFATPLRTPIGTSGGRFRG